MSTGWEVRHLVAPAEELHAIDPPEPAQRSVWWMDPPAPAVVLGSTQERSLVDDEAAASAGVEVARRRSGGGLVLVGPGEVTWVDVVIPRGDPLWDPDVGRAFHVVGRSWAAALQRLGVGPGAVHTGPLVRTRWSDVVCFAGLGPGEVVVDGRKAVGLSQRRTRGAARFQGAVLHRWDPASLLALTTLAPDDRSQAVAEVADVAVGVGQVDGAAVVAALVDALAASS